MAHYRIKNWTKFQHYKDRNPPWIKLHVEILASADWVMLDDASKLLMVVCMVIGAKDAGVISDDAGYFRRVAYLRKEPNFKPLIECGFLEPLADASKPEQAQAEFRPEKEAEQSRAETDSLPADAGGSSVKTNLEDRFEECRSRYRPPKNSKRPADLKAWIATTKVRPPLPDLLRAVDGYNAWLAEESRRQKREYPKQLFATWLRGEGWENYLTPEIDAETLAERMDRADRLMKRGKYAPNYG